MTIDRDRLRKLADNATPGPWDSDRDVSDGQMVVFESRGEDGGPIVCAGDDLEKADAEFIAAARTAVPELLDALTRSEAQSEVRRLQVAYWQERARVMEAGRKTTIRTQAELRQEVTDERGAVTDLLEQLKIRDARIQAVRDVLDEVDRYGTPIFMFGHRQLIRRALDVSPD